MLVEDGDEEWFRKFEDELQKSGQLRKHYQAAQYQPESDHSKGREQVVQSRRDARQSLLDSAEPNKRLRNAQGMVSEGAYNFPQSQLTNV